MRLLSLLLFALLLWAALQNAPTPPQPDATEVSIRYQREDWPHWIDEDGDCQNTRQELLILSSQVPVTFTSERGCTVATGQWLDPYTGNTYTQASDVDIDHVVPLAYAHAAGGATWTREQRERFANDPRNLLVVDDAENQRKGAAGPSEYLPRASFHGDYLRLWREVVEAYGLKLRAEDARLMGL
jgi:hypothetical protein